VITTFAYRSGRTERVAAVDPAWLASSSGVYVWVDLANATPEESRILTDVFHFHELAVDDALSALQYPKLETYESFLYLVLHGIDFKAGRQGFTTHDLDFFLGRTFLVTVHDGNRRSIAHVRDLCDRNGHLLARGPVAILHQIVDSLVDHYNPEIDALEDRLDRVETEVFSNPKPVVVRKILALKRDIAALRRVTLPQRDALGRLARREFEMIPQEYAYGFRDVYDHLVRLTDEALIFQDRVTGILEAHFSNVSNRLNQVMKVLTVIATIFMPLTVLTGAFGMNVELPVFPGGPALQFWWIVGIMVVISLIMLWLFRRQKWL
jgi:magnesium transporter